jgi:hypothetical protein
MVLYRTIGAVWHYVIAGESAKITFKPWLKLVDFVC